MGGGVLSLKLGLVCSRGQFQGPLAAGRCGGTQGPDAALLRSVVPTPPFHRTPLPSSPPQGDHTLLPEPHLAGNCAPLSHVLDEGQELLLSPEQMEEERL